MLHFPTLRNLINNLTSMQTTLVIHSFIHKLIENLAARFDNFHIPAEVMPFAKDPFTVNARGEFAAKAKQVLMSLDEAPSAIKTDRLVSNI